MRLVRHPHIDFNGDNVGGSVNVSGSEDGNSSNNHSGELLGAKPAHPSYNDLSNLFETRKRSSLMFISKHLTSMMAKLEAVTKKMNFRVTRKKSFTVRM
ncbi:uncharacterized protein HKW66_Vig0129570 [Vigna angularis]|uniref:NAF domain-containing protein n=1 Tax=Phaseolus angularis TaxID=3914 RepID=A0A8T0K4Y8_PHAAN|nr:uncharacterized protein HKW66_Vig0129570 [Vigna angularis]